MAFSSKTSGRVAVVTGANKGIGFYIALQLATSGLFSNIILGCRDSSRGNKAVQDIESKLGNAGTKISYLPLDIGDSKTYTSFRDSIEKDFGRLDVLVNNAAFAFKNADPTPFQEQCKATLDVNFRGTLDFTEEMLPLMRTKSTDTRIVNVSSMAGRLRQIKSPQLRDQFISPTLTLNGLRSLVDKYQTDVLSGKHLETGWGNSNYGMSKLALIAATKVLARDESINNVKVNSCCPGYCDTDMTSHKGPRPPEEGAKNAVLLAVMEDCPSGEFYQNMKKSEW